MHYTGMAAFEIEGRIVWDPELVTASIVLGGVLSAAALEMGLRGNAMQQRINGALLLTAAICALHFTAMGAVSIIPDPTIPVSPSALPTRWLAVAAAVASFTIIVLALAGLALDIRDRRRSEVEADRMRGLANAAVEGLIVCRDDVIATANNSFITLAGDDDVVGTKFEAYFPGDALRERLLARPNHPIEAELHGRDGSIIPVELILRFIDFAGSPHRAIAVRDLRARKQAEQHIRFLAHHDALTGLPNRSSFYRKLDHDIEAALGTGQRVAVLCLDLDRFKEVNDLFGHAAGDIVLQTLAKTVLGMLDSNQMMAGLGGDEFAVILPAISGPSAAGRVAENILEALRAENRNSTTTTLISTSIGIALFPQRRDRSSIAAQLCRHGAVPRQDGRTRRLPIFRSGDGCGVARPSAPRARPSPCHLAFRTQSRLPAADRYQDRRDHRFRGAAALAPCHPRRDTADRLHSGGRG
jgi:diguanylate cyclase (GGDEF)-like protein